jgi:uncharacterized small protein (DUF1192 family)
LDHGPGRVGTAEELEAYLAELEQEAGRVREKIAAKKAYLSGADALFKR